MVNRNSFISLTNIQYKMSPFAFAFMRANQKQRKGCFSTPTQRASLFSFCYFAFVGGDSLGSLDDHLVVVKEVVVDHFTYPARARKHQASILFNHYRCATPNITSVRSVANRPPTGEEVSPRSFTRHHFAMLFAIY